MLRPSSCSNDRAPKAGERGLRDRFDDALAGRRRKEKNATCALRCEYPIECRCKRSAASSPAQRADASAIKRFGIDKREVIAAEVILLGRMFRSAHAAL